MQEIIQLRKELHRFPELSGNEHGTAERIQSFLQMHTDAKVLTGIGGTGLAAVFDFQQSGPTVMIRCELDALPISEANEFEHKSQNKGVAHKCGHDGHMAIVAGLASWLNEKPFKKGKAVLLFQPAEETGQGASAVLQSAQFDELKPDYVFALHNIPGEPLHTIIPIRQGFSASVQSFSVFLSGKESHASEPENGINPAIAMAEMITAFDGLMQPDVMQPDFALLTPVHLNMGKKAYGISAGNGEVHYTIRTWSEAEMEKLKERIVAIIGQASVAHGLSQSINWFECFPATKNDQYCTDLIIKAAKKNGFEIKERPTPFKFGEDFGWYSQQIPAAMFGIGAGLDCPALHHDTYDFPDEILATGIAMFKSIISEMLEM